MDALINGGALWWSSRLPSPSSSPRRRFRSPESNPSDAVEADDSALRGCGFNFPLKQATTAASLALAGDAIAQVSGRWKRLQASESDEKGATASDVLSGHDWPRALRMASYGFLLYGPGSYAWYQFLDHSLPKPTFTNLSLKVLLNQIVLGPCVIAIVFAWNNLWVGKLAELPKKYSRDALPTLLYGLFHFKLEWHSCQLVQYFGTSTCPQLSASNGIFVVVSLLHSIWKIILPFLLVELVSPAVPDSGVIHHPHKTKKNLPRWMALSLSFL